MRVIRTPSALSALMWATLALPLAAPPRWWFAHARGPAATALALALLNALGVIAAVRATRAQSIRVAAAGLVIIIIALDASTLMNVRAVGAEAAAAGLLPYVVIGAGVAAFGATAGGDAAMRGAWRGAAWLLALSVVIDAAGLWPRPLASVPPAGLGSNRNWSAEWVAVAVPAGLTGHTAWGWLPLAGAVLVVTRARTALWAALAGSVTVWTMTPAARRPALAGAALLLLAGAGVAGALPWHAAWTEPAWSLGHLVDLGHGSGRLRVEQVAATARALVDDDALLVGFGPGRWSRVVAARDGRLGGNSAPSCDWARVAADGGVVACAGLVLLLVGAAWRCLRARDPARLGLCAALAVASLADAPLYRLETASAIALLFATAPEVAT